MAHKWNVSATQVCLGIPIWWTCDQMVWDIRWKEYKVILTESCMLKVTLGPGDAASTRISGRSSLSPSRELSTKTKDNILFSFITGFCAHANI